MALPFIYTIIWARNHPFRSRVSAKTHRYDGDKLVLVAEDREVPFLEPLEWWRIEDPQFSWIDYLNEGPGSPSENLDELTDYLTDSTHAFAVNSRHASRRIDVFADSEDADNDTVKLLLGEKIVAVFDKPVSWRRHELPIGEGYSDEEL